MGSVFRRRLLVFAVLSLAVLCRRCRAQASATVKRTDPTEARAVNTILERWGKKASGGWNLTGDLCTGAATDKTSLQDTSFNPGIKCDCSSINGTLCHIVQFKVYKLDVVGTIPEELSNLTHLSTLDLRQNYLTGPLPAFIGNFSSMESLSFGINALSGPIPTELGKLQKLVLLGMGGNNFSGPLPPELGALSNLKYWYMDSCGVSGELPPSLSNLKSLELLSASDINFTGKIPDFIGGWTNLTTLRIQGNSFSGPIPSSFSGLSKLTDLRIGDLINGSSSLTFINNMTSLIQLSLRNSKISDTLPSDFEKYNSLLKLDLSFNNITGNIPQSLLNLSSLSMLFLGNNSLTGNIPREKRTQLSTIDLSYNQLSGSFPPWVNNSKLDLNLVANNFFIDDSNSSVLPSGLECLQRDTPCYRGSPIYYQFAIKCGGNASVTSSDGTEYERDNATLNTASYYVTDPNRWGVSSTGSFASFADASKYISNYIISSSSQFQNTLDPELFQASRMSPSSLRYYGLGLENGNYTIELQFAETVILDPPTWKSAGRRIFDIYIQDLIRAGNLDNKRLQERLTEVVHLQFED